MRFTFWWLDSGLRTRRLSLVSLTLMRAGVLIRFGPPVRGLQVLEMRSIVTSSQLLIRRPCRTTTCSFQSLQTHTSPEIAVVAIKIALQTRSIVPTRIWSSRSNTQGAGLCGSLPIPILSSKQEDGRIEDVHAREVPKHGSMCRLVTFDETHSTRQRDAGEDEIRRSKQRASSTFFAPPVPTDRPQPIWLACALPPPPGRLLTPCLCVHAVRAEVEVRTHPRR